MMRSRYTIPVFCLLIFVFSSLHSYTNKTYLRPIDSSFFLEDEFLFSSLILKERKGFDLFAMVDFSVFSWQSITQSKMGKYFGVNDRKEVLLSNKDALEMDVYYEYLVNGQGGVADDFAKVSFSPKAFYSGGNFAFFVDFSKYIKNFYFKCNVPYVRVENDIRMGFMSEGDFFNDYASSIKDYLLGRYNFTANPRQQDFLKNAKVKDKHMKDGVPYVDFILGYKVRKKRDNFGVVSLGLIVPTTSKPSGEYLFEPILPRNDHWAVNLSYEEVFHLLGNSTCDLKLFFDVHGTYFFSNTQKRVLSLKGLNWGHYYLLGRNGMQNEPMIPAANILTKNVSVSGRAQFDANVRLLWQISKLSLSLGYNFLFREEERVKLKEKFPEMMYAVVSPTNYQTDDQFGTGAGLAEIDLQNIIFWIDNKDIDTTAPQTPQLLSHKFYVKVAYSYESKKYDKVTEFALGSSYNFSVDNSTFDGWSIWFNTNISF